MIAEFYCITIYLKQTKIRVISYEKGSNVKRLSLVIMFNYN